MVCRSAAKEGELTGVVFEPFTAVKVSLMRADEAALDILATTALNVRARTRVAHNHRVQSTPTRLVRAYCRGGWPGPSVPPATAAVHAPEQAPTPARACLFLIPGRASWPWWTGPPPARATPAWTSTPSARQPSTSRSSEAAPHRRQPSVCVCVCVLAGKCLVRFPPGSSCTRHDRCTAAEACPYSGMH